MMRAGGGKIVNIGSMMSIFGASFVAPYGASKGGIVQLTRALATAWARGQHSGERGAAGWIDTALTQRARKDIRGCTTQRVRGLPPARWGAPNDLAGHRRIPVVAPSDFITATAIPVDGGYSSQG